MNARLIPLPRGAGMLLSVLIISAALLMVSVTASLRLSLLSVSLKDTEAYTAARAAAWSCIDMVRMRLMADLDRFQYGDIHITLPYNTFCTIISATTTATTISLRVQGNAGASFVKILVTASRRVANEPFHIETWKEY